MFHLLELKQLLHNTLKLLTEQVLQALQQHKLMVLLNFMQMLLVIVTEQAPAQQTATLQ
jgi:hypothetical protein